MHTCAKSPCEYTRETIFFGSKVYKKDKKILSSTAWAKFRKIIFFLLACIDSLYLLNQHNKISNNFLIYSLVKCTNRTTMFYKS